MRTKLAWAVVLGSVTALFLFVLPLELAIVALIVLPIVDWAAVVAITAVLRQFPRVKALEERQRLALAIAALTTLFALLALSRLGGIELPGEVAGRLIMLAVVSLSAINGLFLWQYRHALFGRAADVPVDTLHHEDEEP